MSWNVTDKIAVTIKCVRNKFCASTAQLIHKLEHIGGTAVEANYSVCCAPRPFTPDYADITYRSIGQVPKNNAIENTAVSLHKRQLCNRITTSKKAQDSVNLLIQHTPFTHDASLIVTCDRDIMAQVWPGVKV